MTCCERCHKGDVSYAVLSTLTPAQWFVCAACAKEAMALRLPLRVVTAAEIRLLTAH